MTDVLKNKLIKTRKPHNCQGCARKLPAGAFMEVVEEVDSGTFYRTYWCDICRIYFILYCEYDEEISFGELKDQDPEEWQRIRIKEVADE